MWPHAVAVQRETGTPAHLVVGQAALESGWGRHEIARADGATTHNLFGIKAGQNWKGKTVDAMTTEFVDGRPLRMIQRFRAYDSYAEAFTDWSRLMARNSRYDGVAKAGHDPAAYAQSMQKAGYATDPAYADKLEKSIRRTLALRRLVI
jgi:flagellar protein FlgJ